MVLPWTNWLDFLKRRSSKRAPLFRPVTKPAMMFTENFRQSRVVSSQKSLQLCNTDLKGYSRWRTRLDLGMWPHVTHSWRGLTNRMANNFCSPGCQPMFPMPGSLQRINRKVMTDNSAVSSTEGQEPGESIKYFDMLSCLCCLLHNSSRGRWK